MRRGLFFIVVGVAVLAALFWVFAPAEHAAGTGKVTANDTLGATRHQAFELREGQRVQGPATIAIAQGGVLELRVTTDHDDELHIHGYDRALTLHAGHPATLRLALDHAGRFPVELHESDRTVTMLEISPR